VPLAELALTIATTYAKYLLTPPVVLAVIYTKVSRVTFFVDTHIYNKIGKIFP